MIEWTVNWEAANGMKDEALSNKDYFRIERLNDLVKRQVLKATNFLKEEERPARRNSWKSRRNGLEKICWEVGDKSIAARGRFQGEERIIIEEVAIRLRMEKRWLIMPAGG